MIEFYRVRGREAQIEIVPSFADQNLLADLAGHGYYQSGFHTSCYIDPTACQPIQIDSRIRIAELEEDQFDIYATIHGRGTGLPDSGIVPVAANNQVLYRRPGWKFYMAYVEDVPAAVGVMYASNGLASLTFAATLPEYRRLGLHQMLLVKRIEEAKQLGCRLAISQCTYLSQSHRNMERIGMKIGYTRTTWTKRSSINC